MTISDEEERRLCKDVKLHHIEQNQPDRDLRLSGLRCDSERGVRGAGGITVPL